MKRNFKMTSATELYVLKGGEKLVFVNTGRNYLTIFSQFVLTICSKLAAIIGLSDAAIHGFQFGVQWQRRYLLS
jgi:hypothetical protein